MTPDGRVAATAEVPVHPRAVGSDGVEQDPDELWESVLSAGRQAVEQAGEIDAVAFANQGETVLAWDPASGRALSPAIVWQDRRAESVCAQLSQHAELVEQVSGLKLSSYFAAPKIAWLREHGYSDGVATTTDSWLLHRLTGEFVTDAATASRTALLDLDTGSWSERLAVLFGVDAEQLPQIVDCSAQVGSTDAFGAQVPVAGVAVDQQAALFAQGCFTAGDAKCTYGTGAFLLANTGGSAVRSQHGLVACVAWRHGGELTYCLDGQVYTVGSVVDWLTRLRLIGSPADLDPMAGAARSREEQFVPALAGLAAPYWSSTARGAFTGLSLDTDPAALVRAVIEGLAAAVAVLAEAVVGDLGKPITGLRVDGGLTRSAALMQTQADLLQAPVEVFTTPHATAFGVAALARLGLGWSADPAAAVRHNSEGPMQRYEPSCNPDQARERVARWRRAAQAAIELSTR